MENRSVSMGTSSGNIIVTGTHVGDSTIHNGLSPIKQNLVEAAAQILQIVEQLEQSYPTTTLTEKAVVAEKAIKQIESSPPLKARVIGALKSAGKEALKEAVDHPVANILIAGIEGWQEGV